MKKLIVFLCLFFLSIPSWAEYKPIPKELSKQYKAEMEQIINEGYPQVIRNIDNYFEDVKVKYNKLITQGYDDNIYWSMLPEVSIFDLDLFLYDRLLKVTQEKYLGLKYNPIGTDDTYYYENYLQAYFSENKINLKKLIKIENYANKKYIKIENYIKKIDKLYN